jgi:hypothetical protein
VQSVSWQEKWYDTEMLQAHGVCVCVCLLMQGLVSDTIIHGPDWSTRFTESAIIVFNI